MFLSSDSLNKNSVEHFTQTAEPSNISSEEYSSKQLQKGHEDLVINSYGNFL
jgi:hypothetical protein